MLAVNLAIKGISLIINEIDNYINRLDIAKEKFAETENELNSINNEIESIDSKIKELESMGTLSLTDKEELERLREENKELAIRKKYLEDLKRQESEDIVQYAKEKMNYDYGRETSREDIDAYKKYLDNPEAYGSSYYEDDALTIKIAQYEKYKEQKKEAVESGDLEAIELLDKNLKNIEESLIADRTELQGFKDDLSLTGESSAELDNVNQKLKFIDDLLLAPSENLKNFLNSDSIIESTTKLKELANSGKLTEEQLSKSFPEIDAYLKENNLSFQDLISTLDIYRNEIEEVVGSAEKLSKSGMIDVINSMSDGMDVLDDIYADILDEGTFDFTKLDTSKFSEAFAGLEPQYEKFIETVSAFPNDIDKCQDAFNELTIAYVEQKGILSGVSEENKQLTADMLENMGIANAEEVVMSALGLSFEDYATAKRECASEGINLITATDTEIERLINMKLVSEETAQALFYYQLQKALSNENCLDTSADCANLIMLAQNAGVTGGVLEDLIELEQIQKQLESGGVISEHMLSKLMARAEELNASIKSQSTQFQTTVKPISQYTGAGKTADAMNKKLKDSTDAVTEAMKKEKEALERTKSKIEKKKQYYEDIAEAIDWFYDKQIDKQQKAIDKLEKENELLEERIDYYDGALSAIDRYYEKQIDNLEKQKDALAGNNKEAEIALNLEKRQQELQEAKSRKSISLYQKGKGFVNTTDTSAIKEAEENLAEAQRQKDEADIDAKINKLQEYRDLWAEIPSIKQKAEEDSQMIQLLGAEWESILLEGRISNFTSFKDQYVSLQQQVDNNESMIKSYEEKIAYYESLKLEWDNLLAKYQEDTYTQLLIGAFGNDFENELLNGRTGRWVQFAEDYYNIQVELKDVTDQIEALTARMEEYASRIESAANDAVAAVKKLKEAEAEAKSSKGWYTGGWTSAIKPSGKAKGGIITKNDAGDLDFVAKSVGEDHMVALTEGEAVIPKKSVEQNKDIIRELIATSSKIERFEPNIPDSFDSLKSIGAIPQFNYRIPRGNHSISQVRNENINISIGDIHVHGVQDVNGLSDAIIKEMPNMVIQKINKRR